MLSAICQENFSKPEVMLSGTIFPGIKFDYFYFFLKQVFDIHLPLLNARFRLGSR